MSTLYWARSRASSLSCSLRHSLQLEADDETEQQHHEEESSLPATQEALLHRRLSRIDADDYEDGDSDVVTAGMLLRVQLFTAMDTACRSFIVSASRHLAVTVGFVMTTCWLNKDPTGCRVHDCPRTYWGSLSLIKSLRLTDLFCGFKYHVASRLVKPCTAYTCRIPAHVCQNAQTCGFHAKKCACLYMRLYMSR